MNIIQKKRLTLSASSRLQENRHRLPEAVHDLFKPLVSGIVSLSSRESQETYTYKPFSKTDYIEDARLLRINRASGVGGVRVLGLFAVLEDGKHDGKTCTRNFIARRLILPCREPSEEASRLILQTWGQVEYREAGLDAETYSLPSVQARGELLETSILPANLPSNPFARQPETLIIDSGQEPDPGSFEELDSVLTGLVMAVAQMKELAETSRGYRHRFLMEPY